MKIAIITVCKNAERSIERTILSVVTQTHQNIEYIIVDGASTDNTLEIIKKYEKQVSSRYASRFTLHYISEPDTGIYNAMNKGIKMATGEWIHILNAGDVYFSKDVLSEIFQNDIDPYDVLAFPIIEIREKESIAIPEYKEKFNHYYFPHQGVFVKRTFYEKNGYYSEKYKIVSDGKFFSDRFPKAKIKVFKNFQPVVKMDVGTSELLSVRYVCEMLINILFLQKFSLKCKIIMLKNLLVFILVKTLGEIGKK
jgi:glycosyltransferase involved in cell wall biosynthesis